MKTKLYKAHIVDDHEFDKQWPDETNFSVGETNLEWLG